MYQPNQYNQYPYNNILTPQTNKIYVNSYDEVVKYQMPANSDMLFIHRTEPVLYDKVTDAYGGYIIKTFTIKEKLAEQNEEVSKEELQTISDRLDALEKMLKNTPKVVEEA